MQPNAREAQAKCGLPALADQAQRQEDDLACIKGGFCVGRKVSWPALMLADSVWD